MGEVKKGKLFLAFDVYLYRYFKVPGRERDDDATSDKQATGKQRNDNERGERTDRGQVPVSSDSGWQ